MVEGKFIIITRQTAKVEGMVRTGGKRSVGRGLDGEGERERVHWSELGHQGRVRKKDEKEKEGE